jgi:maltokinase
MTDSSRFHGSDGIVPLLYDWLPQQRWFAGKGRPIHGIGVVSATTLLWGDPSLHHLVVTVEHDGDDDFYQLFVGARPELPHRLAHWTIGAVHGGEHADWLAYDALHDPDVAGWLLERFAGGDEVGPLAFHRTEQEKVPTGLTGSVIGAEQSNTSVVFGDELILKVFRRLSPGVNPDLEVLLALAGIGSERIATPAGWFEMLFAGEVTTLGLLQTFLRTATDGWDLALTSVRDLYAEGDLHAHEVGGDFAPESYRLGAVTAEVHRDLARTLPTAEAGRPELIALAEAMTTRLERAVAVVPGLGDHAEALRGAYADLAALTEPVPTQRIHGDYHLGQVMRTPTGWVVLDFEGEPAKPLGERRGLYSPLRDVAGMLRSFDYAARHLLADYPNQPQLEHRAAEWTERNQGAFCDGYTATCGRDPREDAVLLRAFETDKAVYEAVYEARHRPSWLPIPMSAIHRLASA